MKKSIVLLVVFVIVLTIQYVSAPWSLVPNGGFESGTVGLIPDSWIMIEKGHGPENSTRIRKMEQTDQMYFEGSKSLWLHSRIVNTDGMDRSRSSQVWAETEDWINAPLATHVRVHIRGISSTHSPAGWGWSNGIRLYINNVSVARKLYGSDYKPWIFAHGEYVNWNLYNYTAMGADGESWYVYEYAIPESVDKTQMKIQIAGWAGDWSFYSTSYFSDLEFAVDKVELFTLEQYELTVTSSPVTGIAFTVNGTPQTTEYAEWLVAGSYVLEMPETHTVGDAKYYWDQWSDGVPSRSRTVTLDTNVTLTAYYTGPYYELTVTSSPITEITFTIDGVPETTPYSEWLLEGSYALEMPETYNGYVWSHWLEDGDTNRVKTVGLPGSTWTAVYKSYQPVGGVWVPINKTEPSAPWIGFASLMTVVSAMIVSVVYVRHRKKKQT